MAATYYFRVAGFTFGLVLPEGQNVEALLPSFRSFRQTGLSREPLLFTFSADGPVPRAMGRERLLEESLTDLGHVHLWQGAWGYGMEVRHEQSQCWHALQALADFSRVWATLHWDDPAVGSVLSAMLRASLAQAILPHGAISVHAAAVVLNGMAYLFMGKSGTGKSTHARLWMKRYPDCMLLNDDNPVLRLQDGQVWAYGTPWSGKTPCYRPLSFPVRGIVRLYQASSNRYVPCQDVEAFAALLPGCSVVPGRHRLYQQMTDTLTQMAMLVRVGLLECLPNDDAARFCAHSLGAEGVAD